MFSVNECNPFANFDFIDPFFIEEAKIGPNENLHLNYSETESISFVPEEEVRSPKPSDLQTAIHKEFINRVKRHPTSKSNERKSPIQPLSEEEIQQFERLRKKHKYSQIAAILTKERTKENPYAMLVSENMLWNLVGSHKVPPKTKHRSFFK